MNKKVQQNHIYTLMQAVIQLHPHPNPITYIHTYIHTYIYIYIYIIKNSYPVHKAPPPTWSGRGD